LALWAKEAQNGGEKVCVFCNGYMKLFFFVSLWQTDIQTLGHNIYRAM